jgi:16S rRNA (guanine527-N7)-methyltransferase
MTKSAWQRLPAQALDLFELQLRARELDLFRRYLDELATWSVRVNLLASSSEEKIIERHLLDSLAGVRFLRGSQDVADFGAGAGFPGIPLAVAVAGVRVHLIESRRKRCSFLRHVVRTLRLENVRVWEQRGEEWTPDEAIDSAIGRGLRADVLAALSRRVLAPRGRLLVMRKQEVPEAWLDGFAEFTRLGYRLPGGERHEVAVFERVS